MRGLLIVGLLLCLGCRPTEPAVTPSPSNTPPAEPGLELYWRSPLVAPPAKADPFLYRPFLGPGLEVEEDGLKLSKDLGELRFYLREPATVTVGTSAVRLDDFTMDSSEGEFALSKGVHTLHFSGEPGTQFSPPMLKVPEKAMEREGTWSFLAAGSLQALLLTPGSLTVQWSAVEPGAELTLRMGEQTWKPDPARPLELAPGLLLFEASAPLELTAQWSPEPLVQPSPKPGPESRPPVVIYLVDTLRADRLSCYGYQRQLTPGLDEFARDAVLYEQAMATSPWTLPSVASVLSGRSAQGHTVQDYADGLADEIPTLQGSLKEAGYRCGAFVANPLVRADNLGRSFDSFVPSSGAAGDQLQQSFWQWQGEPSEQTFLAYLHSMEPHAPYAPHPEMAKKWAGEVKRNWAQLEGGAPESVAQPLSQLYDAEVATADLHFSRFMTEMKARGLYDKALIIVVSDHGEELFDHGGLGHMHSLYQELIRVPLLVKFPRSRGGGSRVSTPVSLCDLFPTVLFELGLPGPEGLEGIALQNLSEELRPLYFQIKAGPDVALAKEATAPWLDEAYGVRWGSWVLARTLAGRKYSREPLRLNQLEQDPQERKNLAYEQPQQTRFLEALITAHLRRRSQSGPESDPNQTRRALESLQYL